jgi:nitrite reductase (NO-forming)
MSAVAPSNIGDGAGTSRRRFLGGAGTGLLFAGLAGAAAVGRGAQAAPAGGGALDAPGASLIARLPTVAADPARLPPPIRRWHSMHHEVTLEAREVRAALADGSEFTFMTWNGQVPGPMIRVRQGDTVTLTVRSAASNERPHCIDIHAVYGSGGGAMATLMPPGGTRRVFFKCLYPGAFVYHCAVMGMDEHISRGMFGMVLVEPHEGLPAVDREFYLGQHELYTREPFGSSGLLHFDSDAMTREDPNFVLFNGRVDGLTAGGLGAMQAKVGETVRVFMVNGGPNLTSSFHPVGNVWKRCWPQGTLGSPAHHYVQTQPVAPGSCFVGDMELPVPETVKLVDHALSRVARKGLMAELAVAGARDPSIFRELG